MILGKLLKLSESQVHQFLNEDNKSHLARSLIELNEITDVKHTALEVEGFGAI